MSLTLALNAAVTGLSTAQAGLDVISSNIANVNTEGYTRKVFDQQTLVLAGQGAGVSISQIRSNVDQNLLASMRKERSGFGVLNTLDNYLRQVQDTFGSTTSASSISNRINQLAQDFTTLSTTPDNSTARLQVLQAAQGVASNLSNVGNTLQQLRLNADREITQATNQINSLLGTISTLNDQISLNTATSRGTADLEDKRDVALNSLADLIDIRYFKNANGSMTVFTTDGTTLVDSAPTQVSHVPLTQVNPTDAYASGNFNAITAGVRDITTSIRSGKLKALVDLRDKTLPDMQAQVDELARGLQEQVNLVHNRGTSFPTTVNNVVGTRQFMDPNVETATFSGGETNVVLVDSTGKEVASSRILDPAGINFTNGGTLASLASQIQTWVQAQDPQLVNATVSFNSSGQLAINLGTDSFGIGFRDEQSAIKGSTQADVKVALDIDGDGTVDKTEKGFSNFLGLNDFFTTIPKLTEWTSGFKPSNYTLTTTAAQTLSFSDSANSTGIPGGTITVNPADSLQAIADKINANTALQGVITASVVPEAGGQRLRITSDLGRQIAVTQQGGTDALDALDLNPSAAGLSQTLAVNQTLVDDPSRISSGQVQLDPLLGKYYLASGDNSVALQLSTLMTSQAPLKAAGSLAAGNIAFADYAASIVALSASRTANNKTDMQLQGDLKSSLELKQSQLSGVNLDEEMSQLLVYQNSYAASAKVIATTKALFDILNNLIQ
jgi:flagellar hook-associated protein 1 FlgK